jgi:ABC-type transport system involved in cytochrome c biogenesis permease subunit
MKQEPRMNDTSIQTRPNPAPLVAAARPLRPRVDFYRYVQRTLKALASLRLTVFLFVLSMILIFCGTLAMMDLGLYSVLARYFRSGFVWIPLQIFVRFGQVFFGVPPNTQISGSFPFPGGWSIGAVLLVNLLAAHATRFRCTWKRSGVLVLHAGIILLMLGELITGVFSVESNMIVPLGGSTNYVQSFERYELAFVGPGDAAHDSVTVVPDRLLQHGGTIRNEELPVDVEVTRYLSNSALTEEPPTPGENPATRGFGVRFGVVERPAGRGVDSEQKADTPSAYLTLRDKKSGAALGTYLVSFWINPQKVEIDGTNYEMSLRRQRSYRPFSFQLEELKHENYTGTRLAKRFASLVRIVDPERGEDREALIHMNHPLYYRGETFYQSQVDVDKRTGVEFTGLQVVRNPGWLLPYIACTLVAGGMTAHFLILVLSFLGRIDAATTRAAFTPAEQFVPWVAAGLATIYLAALMVPPVEQKDHMHLTQFGALPLQDQGRIKPFDTLARNSLMIISGRQTYRDDKDEEQPAIRWLLDVMTSGQYFHDANEREGGPRFSLDGEKHRVFRIDNPEVVTMLGLQRRNGSRYSLAEFGARLGKLRQEDEIVESKDPKQLTAFEKGVHDLAQRVALYFKLTEWPKDLYVIPPESPGDEWQTFQEVLAVSDKNAAYQGVPGMILAYARHNVKDFNQELEAYEKSPSPGLPGSEITRSAVESVFNYFEPFYQSMIIYVLVFLLGIFSWLAFLLNGQSWAGWPRLLGRTAFFLAFVTLMIHTLALVARMYLMDRWLVFVTNLYSSALFIGWGCVVLCLVLEKLYHNGVGNVLSGFCGAATMFIGHHLGSDGDTLALLQPVLDTNFWLATHVTCVTMGYTATFVAGFLGLVYILCGVATPFLNKTASNILYQMLYGVVCFATLLSFTGTVLGGIWADQSWGRFWGWDPKENGALLIVIWNALILHARWGGLVKQRGMAVLAVAGNMVTGWSWFGTNQLGVGLHAYGFNNTLATGLVIFWGTQMAAIVVGLLPLSRWTSYTALTATPRPVEPESPRGGDKSNSNGKSRGRRPGKRGDTGFIPGPA